MPLREDLSRRVATVVPTDVQPECAADPTTKASIPIPAFPFELIDNLLEHLHPAEHAIMDAKTTSAGRRGRSQKTSSAEDSPKRDLLACSVVCRMWHTVARAHVFRDVAFVVRAPHVQKERKTLADLDRFLQDFPAAAAAIRALRLGFPDGSRTDMPEQVCVHDVAALLGRVPQLARLHLRNAYLVRNPDHTIDVPARRCALATLKVEYNDAPQANGPNHIVFDDTEVMLQSGLFVRADTLHIASCSVRSIKLIPDRAPDDPPCDLAVGRLVIERVTSGPSVLTALRNTETFAHLRALEVAIVAEPGMGFDMLQEPRFIALLAPQLEHLTLRVQRVQANCGGTVLDVSTFAQLRTLTLGLALGSSIHSSGRALEHVLRSYPLPQLSRAAHPHLRTLTLRLALDPPPDPFFAPPPPSPAKTAARKQQARAPPSWMGALRPRLDEVDRRVVDTVERCGLEAVIVECEARAEAHAGTLVPTMFPMLDSLGQLDLRMVTLS